MGALVDTDGGLVACHRLRGVRSPSSCTHDKVRADEGEPSSTVAVPAVRDQLTTSSRSPVAHDNEIMALAPQSGRLFAATDQWEYSGPSAYGQILVKNSPNATWKIFEQTQSTRVQALDSFPIPVTRASGRATRYLSPRPSSTGDPRSNG